MATEHLDLDAIATEWLQQCGLCDFGVLGPCTCPPGDPRALIMRLVEEIRQLRSTSERFTDPSVTESIAREIEAAKAVPGDPPCCFGPDLPCPRHLAEHLVNAMRAERLVVLTVRAADEIIRHAWEHPEEASK
jgi:hypothetical protein